MRAHHDGDQVLAGTQAVRRKRQMPGALVVNADLEDRVVWLGEREDVPEIVRALDVLLLPSWEEPFGRAIVEALALEVPVVATAVGGPASSSDDSISASPWARSTAWSTRTTARPS